MAFDILFAEGQRRYLESLNAYARQFVQPAGRADVDAVYGIPPTVAIEQRTSRGGRKSTVATLTEIYHFLRLLYVKLGTQHCPDCNVAIDAQSAEAIHAKVLARYRGKRIALLAPLVIGRKGYYTELADWAAARGYPALRVDGIATPTDPWPRLDRFKEHHIELPIADVEVTPAAGRELANALDQALTHGTQHGARAADHQAQRQQRKRRRALFDGARLRKLRTQLSSRSIRGCFRSTPAMVGARAALAPASSFEASTTSRRGEEAWWEEAEADPQSARSAQGSGCGPKPWPCGSAIAPSRELTALSVREALAYFRRLKLDGPRARDRARRACRSCVATARASSTCRPCAISRSTARRRRSPAAKRSASGSRHSSAPICAASATSSMSRRSACIRATTICCSTRSRSSRRRATRSWSSSTTRRRSGAPSTSSTSARAPAATAARSSSNGSLEDLLAARESITGRMLATPPQHPLQPRRACRKRAGTQWLTIRGATRHNLRNLDVALPLERLVCVTGVSGSGKSTLVRDMLHDNLAALVAGARRERAPALAGCKRLDGWQPSSRVLEVDQTPIGKTPRSCPATYVGIWDEIRKLFARHPRRGCAATTRAASRSTSRAAAARAVKVRG